MNFEFLKNLQAMNNIYEDCSNAEKLVKTMPVQSISSARRCAEGFAKFIYMDVYRHQADQMSFAEILSDNQVRKFIDSRDVMDAFHYIRKKGNQASHYTNQGAQDLAEVAMYVLEDLHYVAGETACMLGLVEDYPEFTMEIEEPSDIVVIEDEDINSIAEKMFLEYIKEYDAQKEREDYYRPEWDELIGYSLEGNVEFREYLEFDYRPRPQVIEFMQEYLRGLVSLSAERSANQIDDSDAVMLEIKLMTERKKTVIETSSEAKDEFLNVLREELPLAEKFTVDCRCDGDLREFYYDYDNNDDSNNDQTPLLKKNTVWNGAGMLDVLEGYKRRERFTYKQAVFYKDSGKVRYTKVQNGKCYTENELMMQATPEILDWNNKYEWWTWSVYLHFEGVEADEYPEIQERLHQIVRKHLPESEITYCEDLWEDSPWDLIDGMQWCTKNLKDIQVFLDEINEIIWPIKDELTCEADGYWEIREEFALASWKWTDKGFVIEGLLY